MLVACGKSFFPDHDPDAYGVAMDVRVWRSLCLFSAAVLIVACEKKPATEARGEIDGGIIPTGESKSPIAENIESKAKAGAATLNPVKCPVQELTYAYRVKVRQAFNNRKFDELESMASEARRKKETFGNGSWKIVQFYSALECNDEEPESVWKLHDTIHREWLAAKPQSISANIALADFLVDYAWLARGSGFANTVTEQGWKLFNERLAQAREVLRQGSSLPEKDPYWARVAMVVARGQSWELKDIIALEEEASAQEPKFWGYSTEHAYALLPRWFGKEGDWERYAEKVAARPNGLGDEGYARIVLHLQGYYENIFQETKASWPKTREGLKAMRAKYPDSLDVLNASAKLAVLGGDRTYAKEAFDQMGTRFLKRAWKNPERFLQFKKWADTGSW